LTKAARLFPQRNFKDKITELISGLIPEFFSEKYYYSPGALKNGEGKILVIGENRYYFKG